MGQATTTEIERGHRGVIALVIMIAGLVWLMLDSRFLKKTDDFYPVSSAGLASMRPIKGSLVDFQDQCECVITKMAPRIIRESGVRERVWYVSTRPGNGLVRSYPFVGYVAEAILEGEIKLLKEAVVRDYPAGKFVTAHVDYRRTHRGGPLPDEGYVSVDLGAQ